MARSRKSNSRSSKRKSRRPSNKRSKKTSRVSTKNITLADLLSTTPMALRTTRDPFALPNQPVKTYENIPYNNGQLTTWSGVQQIPSMVGNNPFANYFGDPSASASLPHARPVHPSVVQKQQPARPVQPSVVHQQQPARPVQHPVVQKQQHVQPVLPSVVQTPARPVQPHTPSATTTSNNSSSDTIMLKKLFDELEAMNKTHKEINNLHNGGGSHSILDKMFQIAGSLWN